MSTTGDQAADGPQWVLPGGGLSLARPRVMAVLNVTPDSFSDGGRFVQGAHQGPDVEAVVAEARRLVDEGADILDVGGESTRPGAAEVGVAAELDRVVPTLRALAAAQLGVPLSVDTRKAAVASRAVEAGAHIVNDVSGLADPAMAGVVAETGAGLVIGHLRGVPETMQRNTAFVDVFAEVASELGVAVAQAAVAGVDPTRILVDPGVGFGKDAEHSAALVACGDVLRRRTGCPVLIGASRKRFLGALTGRAVNDRLAGSVAAALQAVRYGASVVRVHDVAATCDALAVADGIGKAREDAVTKGEPG